MRFGMIVMAAFWSLVIVSASALTAYAAGISGTPGGNDVSYPQCGVTLPSQQAFGIVGVNEGLANTTNPCLADEKAWAQNSSGITRQAKVSFYVNTANPGNRRVADWPASNRDAMTGVVVRDPYGACAGKDDRACAWQYGWNMAELDAQIRGISSPGRYRWWLDVETITSWEPSTRNNRADLEGMVAYFHRIGGTVGIYSMASQWDKIVKTIPSTSSLYRLADWITGGKTPPPANANSRPVPPPPPGTRSARPGQGELPLGAAHRPGNRYRHPVDGFEDRPRLLVREVSDSRADLAPGDPQPISTDPRFRGDASRNCVNGPCGHQLMSSGGTRSSSRA